MNRTFKSTVEEYGLILSYDNVMHVLQLHLRRVNTLAFQLC